MKNKSAINAAIWSVIERFSTQIISFFIGVALARLLSPREFGIVGLVTIFITLSNVFIDSGFGNGLIRKLKRTEKDLSTAFIFNAIVGIVAYAILWIISPYVATYFDENILTILLRIVGLNVLLNSLCVVQNALLTANLDIKKITYLNVCGQIPAGAVAIILAYNGFGVYALAIQTVLSSLIKTLLLWLTSKWKPKESFNEESFKYLWNFGSKLLGTNLLGTFFSQIYSVLIGKYIGKEDLGYFSKSQSLNGNISSIIEGVVQKVALPMLSSRQNDIHELREAFRKSMCILVMLSAPIAAFFCFAAEDIVVFIWTEKWLPSAFLLQMLVVGSIWQPISTLSLTIMQVVNRTDMMLKLEIPKKTLFTLITFIGFLNGLKALVISMVVYNIIGSMINMYPTKRLLHYNIKIQIIDIIKYIVISFPLAYFIKTIFCIFDTPLFNIILMLFLFLISYFFILYSIKDQGLMFFYNRIRKR